MASQIVLRLIASYILIYLHIKMVKNFAFKCDAANNFPYHKDAVIAMTSAFYRLQGQCFDYTPYSHKTCLIIFKANSNSAFTCIFIVGYARITILITSRELASPVCFYRRDRFLTGAFNQCPCLLRFNFLPSSVNIHVTC